MILDQDMVHEALSLSITYTHPNSTSLGKRIFFPVSKSDYFIYQFEPMRMFTGFILLAFVFLSCNKNSQPAIPINGFVVTDAYGNVMTNIGAVDDDWKIGSLSTLPAKEQEVLMNHDSLPPLSTAMSDVTVYPAYPNPASLQSSFTCTSKDSVLMHMIIVDEKATVYKVYSVIMKGITTVAFDFSDRSKFPSGKSLRCLYTFSAAGHQNFKAGHGDIKVCDQSNFNNCF